MSKFWSQLTHQLAPYTPGEQPQDQQYIKLNTNENPYPPSPKAIAAMKDAASDDMRLYPDPNAMDLKWAIANYYEADVDQVFVGNSSDEVLAHTFAALLKHDKPLLIPDISYSFYPVYCKLFGIESQTIPLKQDFTIDVNDYQNAGGIIFPNPNAPTGIALSLVEIEIVLKNNPDCPVVIDEAYVDFGSSTAISLINLYPNLLVTQTFSKSRSLAGLRVGFALGQAGLIEGLERVKNSFNSYPLDRAAIDGASAAIADSEYFGETCEKIIVTRHRITRELEALDFDVLPSNANFVFVKHREKDAKQLYLDLKENGVLVRYFDKPRISDYLRITIGTDADMQVFLQKLKMLL